MNHTPSKPHVLQAGLDLLPGLGDGGEILVLEKET